jgi:hypothetical protein
MEEMIPCHSLERDIDSRIDDAGLVEHKFLYSLRLPRTIAFFLESDIFKQKPVDMQVSKAWGCQHTVNVKFTTYVAHYWTEDSIKCIPEPV